MKPATRIAIGKLLYLPDSTAAAYITRETGVRVTADEVALVRARQPAKKFMVVVR